MTRNKTTFQKTRQRLGAGIRALRARLFALVSPVSKDEDRKRRELILNVILLASFVFLAFLDTTVIANSIRLGSHYHGISRTLFTLMVVGCIGMLFASKRGYAEIVSYGIIGLYTAGALYGGWYWGISLPATLLSFALISVTSSILISSSFGFIMSGFLIISLGVLSVHEIYTLGILPWKYETITATDVVTYSSILIFIATLSWLSNREIQKSLDRARASERDLAMERDLLEIKVYERTEELRRAQAERMAEISRVAEFGKMSQGLFHDLMGPLSTVSLHMERLRNVDMPEAHEARAYLKKAIAASHKMGNFMNLIRGHIRQNGMSGYEHQNSGKKYTSISHELQGVLELLEYRTREAKINLDIKVDHEIFYDGNPIWFQRIFLNVISNAIEAHEGASTGSNIEEKRIDITINKKENIITMIISNNGPEIPMKNMGRIFDPFFSTKSPDKGIGVGLSTVREIVEKELGGAISVESIAGKQTSFVISFPAR